MESKSLATYKTKGLLKDVQNKISKDLDFNMKDLLSICESEIEKLMIMQLYRYFLYQKFEDLEDWDLFDHPQFILEREHLFHYRDLGEIKLYEDLKNEIEFKKFRHVNGLFEKYIGFKTKKTIMDNNPINGKFYSSYQEFSVYPQFYDRINNKTYRIDIAILLNRLVDGKVVETRKIALECDGYDYHSSPEQKKRDDIRSRELKVNGWKEIFRYSGREIVQMKEEEIHSIFNQITTMLYL